MEDRYIGCMLLHAVGDTVGYKNSEWEFMIGSFSKTFEKLYEFIDLGGITNISLKNWKVSDDTILHIKTAISILHDFNSINSLGKILKTNFLDALKQFKKEGYNVRSPGKATLESLFIFDKGGDWKDIPYDLYNGGSGAAMRSLCIGLAFHGEENRHKLIQIAIESGRMTNNSTVGYLGGLASALFTAFAIENKHINKWPCLLLELFNNGTIDKYIRSAGRDVEKYEEDHHIFLEKWHRYVDDKFNNEGIVIKRKSSANFIYREKYYHETFGLKTKSKDSLGVGTFIGSGGDDSVIIALDCLIDSGDNWEKLVYYSMLHMGDTDTTGAIAAGLFGALYGYKNIPHNFLEHIEYKKELTDIGKQLFNKYYDNKI